jgi:GNAT superfamily N-acetyltransferase
MAEYSGSVAGYLIAVYVLSLEHGGVMAEIEGFFVSPGYRSAGSGKALLLKCEDDMRWMGIV